MRTFKRLPLAVLVVVLLGLIFLPRLKEVYGCPPNKATENTNSAQSGKVSDNQGVVTIETPAVTPGGPKHDPLAAVGGPGSKLGLIVPKVISGAPVVPREMTEKLTTDKGVEQIIDPIGGVLDLSEIGDKEGTEFHKRVTPVTIEQLKKEMREGVTFGEEYIPMTKELIRDWEQTEYSLHTEQISGVRVAEREARAKVMQRFNKTEARYGRDIDNCEKRLKEYNKDRKKQMKILSEELPSDLKHTDPDYEIKIFNYKNAKIKARKQYNALMDTIYDTVADQKLLEKNRGILREVRMGMGY